jgi:hypothetical protein
MNQEKQKEQLQEDVDEAVEQLLDISTTLHFHSASDETFTFCHICGEWEEHKDNCFIPLLKKWFDSDDEVKMEE